MTEKPVVVFSDVALDAMPRDYFAGLAERVTLLSPDRAAPDVIASAKTNAIAWIARFRPITATDLGAMPQIKLLSAWGVGYNHIDVAAATARGIPVCVNPVFSRSMAEAALTLILALAKRLPILVRDARTGRRAPDDERGSEIRDKTLGVIGLGRIGQDIGDLGQRLEMRVIAYDPILPRERFPTWCEWVTLDGLLARADFVVVVAPLTAETHHLIGARELAQMKANAFLINIARGPLVDENALSAALKANRIAGAGLDVWEQEPVRTDHPLLAFDNVIGTSHRLGATHESLRQVCEAIQANVLRVLGGNRPENVINPQIFQGEAK